VRIILSQSGSGGGTAEYIGVYSLTNLDTGEGARHVFSNQDEPWIHGTDEAVTKEAVTKKVGTA